MGSAVTRWLPRPVKAVLRRSLSTLGYRLEPTTPAPDFERDEIATWNAVRRYTMSTPERVVSLVRAVEHLVRSRIPGDIVECGVWRGGSMMAVAHTLMRLEHRERDLVLFDTFEGMTQPGDHDFSYARETASSVWRSLNESGLAVSQDVVRRNVESTGYPSSRIRLVKGDVGVTLPDAAPERIALLRLDTDWYESTKHELCCLYPRLTRGGILIIDDYGHWLGSRKATDEFLADLATPLFLSRIDYTARIAVKP